MDKKMFLFVVVVAIGFVFGGIAIADENPFEGYRWIVEHDTYLRAEAIGIELSVRGEKLSEGSCFRISRQTGTKVYTLNGQYFVRPKETASDPRNTRHWEALRLNPSPSANCLWLRVQEAASTFGFDNVTEAIICDMVRQGVIPGVKKRSELNPHATIMSRRQLDDIMRDYSGIRW